MTYNAVTWLLDRNVDEGRGNKIVFDDTVAKLSYGELQKETRRLGNLLRRLGVRREDPIEKLARSVHLGVRGQDLFGKARSRARQPDDEHRSLGGSTARTQGC